MTRKSDKNQFWSTDKGILIICIGISTIFWIFVKLSKDYTTTVSIPIQYELPMTRALSYLHPNEINTTIEGNGWDLFFLALRSNISPLKINVNPELEQQTISNRELIKKIIVNLSNHKITVKDVNYDFIHIKTDSLESKTVPIKIVENIQFENGKWYASEIEYSPDSVLVIGPASEINHLTYWSTMPISPNGLEETTELKINLEKPINTIVRLQPEKIKVVIPVEEQTVKSIFIPVEYINNRDSISLFPSKIKVSATVGISKFEMLTAKDYTIIIDFEKLKKEKGKNTIPVVLARKPTFIRNVQFSPPSVEYFIIRKDSTALQK